MAQITHYLDKQQVPQILALAVETENGLVCGVDPDDIKEVRIERIVGPKDMEVFVTIRFWARAADLGIVMENSDGR